MLQAQNRIKHKRQNLVFNEKKKAPNSKYISELFTRTLISVILVLAVAIYINISDANLINFNNKFFKDTLAFSEINKLYTKYFGNILPESVNKSLPVFENTSNYKNISEYNENAYKVDLTGNTFNYLESGVVVFIGEKDTLGKTIIVQGIDGVDIWYSNIENINLTLYDYVEKNNIIGEFKENSAILTFIENGNPISYEKYLS